MMINILNFFEDGGLDGVGNWVRLEAGALGFFTFIEIHPLLGAFHFY